MGASQASELDLTGGGERRKQKKFAEDVTKGLIDKVRDKGKTVDPNFWVDDEGNGLDLLYLYNKSSSSCRNTHFNRSDEWWQGYDHCPGRSRGASRL